MEETEVSEADWDTATGRRGLLDGSPRQDLETDQEFTGAPWEERDSTEAPGEDLDIFPPALQTREPSLASPRLIPAPVSPDLSIQPPFSSPLPTQPPPLAPSFDMDCTPSQSPAADLGQNKHLSHWQLRE